jgi:hypothetical protein
MASIYLCSTRWFTILVPWKSVSSSGTERAEATLTSGRLTAALSVPSLSFTPPRSLTLLFSQNVAGLQIRTPQEEWKFVKPVTGGITVNRFVSSRVVISSCYLLCASADVLQFLTKGYVKSTIRKSERIQIHAESFLAHGNRRSCCWPSAGSGSPPPARTRQS